MITVEVVRIEGRSPAVPQSASFDELGGTIGRGVDCTLVLSDDKRSVSRQHAKISFEGGQYRLIDQGTNPLRVNGNALGKGNSVALQSGDQLSIGPFELEVRMGAAVAPTVADSLITSVPSPSSSQANPLAGGSSGGGGGAFDDLLAPAAPPSSPIPPGAAATPPSDDPFADLGFSASPEPARAPLPSTPTAAAPAASAIPDDFDFMAPPATSGSDPLGTSPDGPDLSDDLFDGLQSSPDAPGAGSLDAMFGLSSSPSEEPFQGGSLGKPPPEPGSHDSGLTQWLGAPRQADTGNPVPDHVPELDAPFLDLPTPRKTAEPPPTAPPAEPVPAPTPVPTATPVAATPAPAPVPAPRPATTDTPPPGLPDLDVDLDDLFGLQSPPPDAGAASPAPPSGKSPEASSPAALGEDLLGMEPAAQPAPSTPAPASAPAAASSPTSSTVTRSYDRPPPAAPRTENTPPLEADHQELLDALLAGLDAKDVAIDAITPELMFRLGSLLHEAVGGTIALLGARGTVKREMRADVTMIAGGANNPLKFSPDAKLAMRYMFGPPMAGFMDAESSMRDAYADLRAHEFGFMAGLRAALSGVLKRFDPAELESQLPAKSGLSSLLSLGPGRKGKLWDMFDQLYRQLAAEAEEDFHNLFGVEFLRAYEEHVAALERQRRNPGPQ